MKEKLLKEKEEEGKQEKERKHVQIKHGVKTIVILLISMFQATGVTDLKKKKRNDWKALSLGALKKQTWHGGGVDI